jgi:hypothetical protein
MNQLFLLPLALIVLWFGWKLLKGTLRLILVLILGIAVYLLLRDSFVMYYLQWFQ